MSIEVMKQMANYIDSLGGDSKKYRQAIAEAEKQEPVGHADLGINNFYWFNDQEQRVIPEGRQALYTHPPKREWVGLTDDEVYKIAFALEGEHWRKIADAIEAKHKQKNT